jgi:hypothetical protein
MERETTYRLQAATNLQSDNQLVTLGDLAHFKNELFKELRYLLGQKELSMQKQWLKSCEVRALLGISPGTLQHLRDSGQLPFTRMGGTIYYDYTVIQDRLKNGV